MAETGRHPSSLRYVRMPTAARTPPHWPAEYVTMALGLKEKRELPKWFSKSANAGLME